MKDYTTRRSAMHNRFTLSIALLLASLSAWACAPALAAAKPPTPIITLTAPTAGAKYALNQVVNAQFSCTNATSCKGWQAGVETPNGTPIVTNSLGAHAFAVKAVNTVKGSGSSSASKTVNYTVTAAAPPPGCPNGYVALTFDDGPTNLSQQYVDALNAGGAHATFFNVGNSMTASPTVAGMELANGNAIGDHTMTHASLTGQSTTGVAPTDAQIMSEVQGQVQLAFNQTGAVEGLFRPPYGDMNQHTFDLVQGFGLTSVMWTTDTLDWQNPPTATIVSRFLAGAHNQAVILTHDGRPNTLAAIPGILAGLKTQGLCSGRIVPDPTNANGQHDYNQLPMNWKVVAW